MTNPINEVIDLGQGKTITLETGLLAKQADGAVVARLGDTMVLCTAVVADPREGLDFFPLTVEYREKFAAGGKIPGGFIKREGRPSDKEILSARLIDRAIRPLFPDGFRNETQIIANVISADGENDADVLAGTAASAALMLGGAPFDGPFAHVRVGRVDGSFIINPTGPQLEESDFNLVVAGQLDSILMVEGELKEVSEEDVVLALEFAHASIREICLAQIEMARQAGVVRQEVEAAAPAADLLDKVKALTAQRFYEHVRAEYSKDNYYSGYDEIVEDALASMLGVTDPEAGTERAEATEEGYTAADISKAAHKVGKDILREMVLSDNRRLDGRAPNEIRPIWGKVRYVPRPHGSAVFTRGETQALAFVTLGSSRDVQAVDQVFDSEDKRFFLHYTFPPFCTGEAKPIRGVSRREVGHGYLAERALKPVIPSEEDFPYTVRIASEILESNGSSSMATVCAGSMALFDAGVPTRAAVAGIAMGLIVEGDRLAILSDILGTEDHIGDMDFKVTGTEKGITACQMDIKIEGGLSADLMRRALSQARDGRNHILAKMAEVIDRPNEDLSPYAPRLYSVEIDTEFIGAIIGPGGKVIQGIQRETDTKIDIEERDNKGFVLIAATDEEKAQKALEQIKQIIAVPEVGEEYDGHVLSVEPFGAIVEVLPGKAGLLHVSELDYGYVERVEDYLKPGDTVKVKLIEIKDGGKLRLSRKPFLEKPEGYVERPPRQDGRRSGGRDGSRRGDDRGRRRGPRDRDRNRRGGDRR